MVADGQLSDARYERLRVADRTGDYVWAEEAQPTPGTLRPLRDKPSLLAA